MTAERRKIVKVHKTTTVLIQPALLMCPRVTLHGVDSCTEDSEWSWCVDEQNASWPPRRRFFHLPQPLLRQTGPAIQTQYSMSRK